ncbi:ABC-2 transporter permease [Halalkalibacterium halodurans]|uniref:ABC-2 transporter permease n=1 Tax=Halalkalibacterium halodurans TaxID=86665 RepID=UPI001FBBFC85|nr:ABC-2 transporter permease [Halalkalibacterium halodurans]
MSLKSLWLLGQKICKMLYLFKPGHITTVILVSFILLAGIGPSVVMFLAEHLTAITDFIVNLSVPALYTGAAIVIITLYAISWGATTFIYQRKAL